MENLGTKTLIQILENQRHILYELSVMHSSGRVHTGLYFKDEFSEKLQEKSFKIIEELKLEG